MQNNNSNEKDGVPTIKRRTVLSGAGLIVGGSGFSGLATGSIVDRQIGSRLFCEISILHENIPDGPIIDFDPMMNFLMDKENRKMHLTPLAGTRAVREFTESDVVSTGIMPSYHKIGGKIERRRVQPRIDRFRRLQVESDYSQPEIRTRRGPKDSIAVEIDDETVTVDSETQEELVLNPVKVEYYEDGPSVEVVGRDGKLITTNKAIITSAEITPKISIQNHGVFDIMAPTEVAR